MMKSEYKITVAGAGPQETDFTVKYETVEADETDDAITNCKYVDMTVKEIKAECTKRKLKKTTGKNREQRVLLLIANDHETVTKAAFLRGSVVDPTTPLDPVDMEVNATTASKIVLLNALFSANFFPDFIQSGNALTRNELDLKATKENAPLWTQVHEFILDQTNNTVLHECDQIGLSIVVFILNHFHLYL